MYRRISLALVTVAALVMPALVAAPAQAADPVLYCQVIPSRFGARPNDCGTTVSSSSWVLDYGLAFGPTTGLSWRVPNGYPVVGGCVSSTPFCDLVANRFRGDQEVTVDVSFVDANGTFITRRATEYVPLFCGPEIC